MSFPRYFFPFLFYIIVFHPLSGGNYHAEFAEKDSTPCLGGDRQITCGTPAGKDNGMRDPWRGFFVAGEKYFRMRMQLQKTIKKDLGFYTQVLDFPGGDPKGTRTPVFGVRGRRPRPLDDGAIVVAHHYMIRPALSSGSPPSNRISSRLFPGRIRAPVQAPPVFRQPLPSGPRP